MRADRENLIGKRKDFEHKKSAFRESIMAQSAETNEKMSELIVLKGNCQN